MTRKYFEMLDKKFNIKCYLRARSMVTTKTNGVFSGGTEVFLRIENGEVIAEFFWLGTNVTVQAVCKKWATVGVHSGLEVEERHYPAQYLLEIPRTAWETIKKNRP
jgi:hypothetical protein